MGRYTPPPHPPHPLTNRVSKSYKHLRPLVKGQLLLICITHKKQVLAAQRQSVQHALCWKNTLFFWDSKCIWMGGGGWDKTPIWIGVWDKTPIGGWGKTPISCYWTIWKVSQWNRNPHEVGCHQQYLVNKKVNKIKFFCFWILRLVQMKILTTYFWFFPHIVTFLKI